MILHLALFLLGIAGLQGDDTWIVKDIDAVVKYEQDEAYLDCIVAHLGNYQVSWMKQSFTRDTVNVTGETPFEGFDLVSIGTTVFSMDPRYEIRKSEVTKNNHKGIRYRLVVKQSKKEDSADYRCIVEQNGKDWADVPYKDGFLLILPQDVPKAGAILEPFKEDTISVKKGKDASLTCNVLNKADSHNIIWMKRMKAKQSTDDLKPLSANEKLLDKSGKYSIAEKVSGKVSSYSLTIKKVNQDDQAAYRCISVHTHFGKRLSRMPHQDVILRVY